MRHFTHIRTRDGARTYADTEYMRRQRRFDEVVETLVEKGLTKEQAVMHLRDRLQINGDGAPHEIVMRTFDVVAEEKID